MEVVDYDPELPAIKFSDESWEVADWVVACDGVKSKAVRIVSGGETPPKATGMSAFSMVIPDEKMASVKEMFKENNLIREKFNKDNGTVWFIRGGDRRLVVWWTCRFGKIQAFDMLMPDNEKYASNEEWTARCDKVCSRVPPDTLHKGKLCMLGDALHPTPPFRAQGGSQSIEDAGALERIATNIVDKSDLPRRLEMLDRLRVSRYPCAQMISSVRQDDLNLDERYIEVPSQCRKWF
ncbi:uncharacterized protein A1O5_11475 [Cladophialophora psammophila CBS 110553]|uniref:FAD-binding domain-containing protein n=1 Tax=Cladophialophora psammophila CBS 110553 TaxID=1182543 RepID=W9WFS3_9EURO|nr:uncharacterized protein A1O5_11475 [Cladophialophora psammophila CBS 110553]EXJ63426.1 hypothetical protein A1O5_11475 [Cladophialophora psammophila CBS 110553]